MKVVVQRISLLCDSFSQRRAAIILEVEVNVFACSATISACSQNIQLAASCDAFGDGMQSPSADDSWPTQLELDVQMLCFS